MSLGGPVDGRSSSTVHTTSRMFNSTNSKEFLEDSTKRLTIGFPEFNKIVIFISSFGISSWYFLHFSEQSFVK